MKTGDVGLRGYRVQDGGRMQARRQEILLAMAEVIAEKGYTAATLEDVAARMGTSRAVIYYQFRSKEEIYVELRLEAARIVAGRLREIVARGLPVAETVRLALRDLLDVGTLPINRTALTTAYPRNLSRESWERIRQADREYDRLLMDLLEHGMAEGVLVRRDPRMVAYTLIHGVNSSFLWRRSDGPLPPAYFAEELPAMLMGGLLARPENEGS